MREREEWGDPRTEEGMALLRQYCPLTNIIDRENDERSQQQQQLYPSSVLVTCNQNDTMVTWQGALKYVKRLRSTAMKRSNVLMYVDAFDGHYVPDDKIEEYYSTLFTWAMNAVTRQG